MKYGLAGLLVLTLLAGSAPARAQGVSVGITPWSKIVAPGDTFQLDITVLQAGAAFNAYDAVIGFDPAALTFLPLSPTSLQQGSLMTGVCGNTFHIFTQGTTTLTINHSLLCKDRWLYGPGQLYKLRFKATGPLGTVTYVRFLAGLQFYDGGVYVPTDLSQDAAVLIGYGTGVGAPDGRGALRLSAAPNPCRAGAVVRVESAAAGPQSVAIRDAAGRLVRRLQDGTFAAGSREVRWDGRDSSGARAPSGVYCITVSAAGREATRRLVVLR